jgi:CRISPR system Cascade subunit CasA
MSINSFVENKFNLVEEPWIPAAGMGRISLRQAFSDREVIALGGNPIQKLAVTKLLLAIAQAAYTPLDSAALDALCADEFSERCLDYLDRWKDRFWLYGERPFLQMPAIEGLIEKRRQGELKEATSKSTQRKAEDNAKPKPIGLGYYPDMPAENNTIISHYEVMRDVDDADSALFVLMLMNFAFGGKHCEKRIDFLIPDSTIRQKQALWAPSIGRYGYLHSHLTGPILVDTIMLNLLSHEQIHANDYWVTGLGIAPWEKMPTGENCEIAQALMNSYMSTLLSLARFVLLKGGRIYYLEGIRYDETGSEWREPGIAVNYSSSKKKVVWADPNKRPWREIVSMLSFIDSEIKYDSQFISYGLPRARNKYDIIGIWSGGLCVSWNAGNQFVKQNNDFVESNFSFQTRLLKKKWYQHLKIEMIAMEKLSEKIFSATKAFYESFQPMQKSMSKDRQATRIASQASMLYWQLCERNFQALIIACEEMDKLPAIRSLIAQNAMKSFEAYCPKDTSRQLEAWAKCKPNLFNYLNPKA